MKLRNKKTGEIRDTDRWVLSGGSNSILFGDTVYNSLAGLCGEWEDYEEPKELYIVDARHECCVGILKIEDNPEWCARLIELGLGFETKEEAEKAVEKLKAWKRLDNEGVRFFSWFYNIDEQKIKITAKFKEFEEVVVGQTREDLDLLFEGDE